MRNLAEKTQKRIESLYSINPIKSVGNFITNKTKYIKDFIGKDKKTKSMIYKNKEYGFTCCKILEDKLESIVYISPQVTKNLKENNPFKSLNERNITDFLVLAEETDHWEYLNTKFELKKIPSKFELELQAAVTKYWLSIRLMIENKDELTKKDINFIMFNVFPNTFSVQEKENILKATDEDKKYVIANILAKDYCKYLTGNDINTRLFSLRKFYWMDGKEKVDYVMKNFNEKPTL